MSNPAQTESQKLANGFRTCVGKLEGPGPFTRELVTKAKELHQTSPKDYEDLVNVIVHCLEQFTLNERGNAQEVLATVAAIGVLLDLELTTGQLSDCYNYIRLCVNAADNSNIQKVSTVFGKYLSLSNPNDQIRKQIENAVQWMAESRTDNTAYIRKLTAVHLLKEAANFMPLAFIPFIMDFFTNIWTPLCDGQSELRDSSLLVFKTGIQVLNSRPRHVRQRMYNTLFSQLRQQLSSKSVDQVVGGLLAFESIVLGSQGSTENRYDEAMSQVWSLTGHSVHYVKQLVMGALTVLAKYNTSIFVEANLRQVVNFALTAVNKEQERPHAFKMLSEIVVDVGAKAFEPHLDQTIQAIKAALIQTKMQKKPPVWEVLGCLSTICKVTGGSENVEAHVKSCIEHVFGWGLSQNLITNLKDIVNASTEETQIRLQEHLLDMISITLCGMQFRQRVNSSQNLLTSNSESLSPEKIVVALNALVQFDFKNSELMGDFLRDSVMPFLDSEFGQVRHAAINTISKLLFPTGSEVSIARRIIVDYVLSRLLLVAVADTDVSVRKAILLSFHEQFFPYLAEMQFLRHLFSALSDECFDVRLQAVQLLCRLMELNPSIILPVMRREFIMFIENINTEQLDVQIEGLKLLTMVAIHAPEIVAKFLNSITPRLVTLLNNTHRNAPMTLPLLEAIAGIAEACGPALNRNGVATTTVSRVCEILGALSFDKSIQIVRRKGLRAIAAVIQHCGESSCPYKVHPTLYKLLTSIVLNKDECHQCRLEAVRIFGIVGALDPHKVNALELEADECKTASHTDGAYAELNHSNGYKVVLSALSETMDPNDSSIASNTQSLMRSAIKTLLLVCERCPSSASEIHVVFPAMVDMILEMPDSTLFTTILYTLPDLVAIAGVSSLLHADNFNNLIQGVWKRGPSNKVPAVRLLTVLMEQENEECASINKVTLMAKYLPLVVPLVLNELQAHPKSDALGFGLLEFLLTADMSLQPFAMPLMRTVVAIIDDSKVSVSFVSTLIGCLRQLCRKPVLQEFAAPIIRATVSRLTAFLSTTLPVPTDQHPFVRECIGLFDAFLIQLQGDFAKFIPATQRLLKSYHINNSEFQYMCSQVVKGVKVSMNTKTQVEMESHFVNLTKELSNAFTTHKQTTVEVWALDEGNDKDGIIPNPSLTSSAFIPDAITSNALTNQQHIDADAIMPIGRETQIVEKTKQSFPNKNEWRRWFDGLCLDILRESPHYIYRCVSLHLNSPSIAERAPAFVSAIINPAFRCFWAYASTNLRFRLKECFERVLPNSTAPDDVILSMLSIAEYMDIVGSPLPISNAMLSAVAQSKGVLAKALSWKEKHYRENAVEATQGLITLYGEVGHTDSATGLLNLSSDDKGGSLWQSSMLKLGRYAEALHFIEMQEGSEPLSPTGLMVGVQRAKHQRTRSWSTVSDSTGESFSHVEDPALARRMEIEVSKIECLSELGEMHRVVQEWMSLHARNPSPKKPQSPGPTGDDDEEENILNYIAKYAADAAVRLDDWEVTKETLAWMRDDDIRLYITKGAIAIQEQQWPQALELVAKGRELLLDDISSLLHESYNRAYETIVLAQQLTEMEETIEVLRMPEGPRATARRVTLCEMWADRISSMAPEVDCWKRVLGTRGLLIKPQDDVNTHIKFARLCREQEQHIMERFSLEQMLGCRSPTKEDLLDPVLDPNVVFEYVKHLSSCHELGKNTIYGDEKSLVQKLIAAHEGKPEMGSLLARMHVRCGDKAHDLRSAVDCYKRAIDADNDWFRAWHYWARANAEILNTSYSHKRCANAIEGYVNSIKLAPSSSSMIQDVLKLLSLWGQHCDHPKALEELRKHILGVNVTTWLLVIPQLIAKLDTGSDESCELVSSILSLIAKERPQTLIYPLTVCTSSTNERRKMHASKILQTMKGYFPQLVAQGGMVSKELIRLAILLHEQWHAALEESATLFFNKHDPEGMVELLLPLHDELARAPENIAEVEFHQNYERQLKDARDWLKSYQKTRDIGDINSAWYIYHAVYKAVDTQIKAKKELHMQFCSPRLWEAKNLELTIPQARPKDGDETVRIAAFDPNIYVISSKQRPRRIGMIGTDGRTHKFLLKGREDLRLDERVMQLFKLVNTLLLTNAATNKIDGYQIQRYSVTPLWGMVGLLGWVEECDTIHELVAAYRKERDVEVELELKMIGHILPEVPKAFDHLSVMQKVEVLEFLQDNTSGQDVRRAMWGASASSEVWLTRRSTFTRSLATMSVVGYILGLGDRHPNNIMIQRSTGKVVHIDFGDCFEVAITRDKFPERVPFRLTRMLRNAMDVSMCEGTFRTAAETVMAVLRDSRSSVTAMLEAFVHDPLISWRLVNKTKPEAEESGTGVADAAMDASLISPTSNSTDDNDTHHTPEQLMERAVSALPANSSGGFNRSISVANRTITQAVQDQEEVAKTKKMQDEITHEGVAIMKRLQSKLEGRDFGNMALPPKEQVDRLIEQATDVNNVAQSWSGWYPFW